MSKNQKTKKTTKRLYTPTTNMEVDNPLFVEDSSLPRGHAIHFNHVMCENRV